MASGALGGRPWAEGVGVRDAAAGVAPLRMGWTQLDGRAGEGASPAAQVAVEVPRMDCCRVAARAVSRQRGWQEGAAVGLKVAVVSA